MAKRYFDKFPIINYNGYNIRNITTSAKLINKYANFPYVYSTIDIDKEQRADQIANQYYDDPYMTWMLYYSNKITDPYYDWYLPPDQFDNFLIKKYGSISYTYRKIVGFRTNWYEDNRELSQDEYNNQFGTFKFPDSNYWNPEYDNENNTFVKYVRKEIDHYKNTNKLCKVIVSNNSAFSEGLLVDLKSEGIAVGNAEVMATGNNNTLYIKNVLGNIANGYSINVYNNTSINTTITSFSNTYQEDSDSWTRINIPDDEFIYWTPYTINDVETEKNESKKTIKLVDGKLAMKLADKLEDELGGR